MYGPAQAFIELMYVAGIWHSDFAINICGSVFVWYYVLEVSLRMWAFGPLEYIRFVDYNNNSADGAWELAPAVECEEGEATANIRARQVGSVVGRSTAVDRRCCLDATRSFGRSGRSSLTRVPLPRP